MINFLRTGGDGAMWARLESPRASYATPATSGTTRAPRRRQLPTNHRHAARPLGATRAYQRDPSSKTPHPPLPVAALRNSSETRGSDPPKISLDGRSFHISYSRASVLRPRITSPPTSTAVTITPATIGHGTWP